ncbi:MAG: HAMP domain-containing protein, partial [Desulfamplus sp.]|nr:HAMP domain-containing protein [Desulfamplus sp.]
MKNSLNKILFGKIRYKIMAGTLIICFLMIGVGFSAIGHVKQISNQVNELTNNLSHQMTLIMDIASKAVLARVYANAHTTGHTQDSINEFIRNYRELNTVIDKLEPFVIHSQRSALVQKIRISVQEYGTVFTRVAELIRTQQDVVFNEVDRNQYIIDNRLSALRVALSNHGNFRQFLAFGNAQVACMQMQNNIIQYIQNRNERYSVLFKKAYINAQNELNSLLLLSEVPIDKKNINDTKDATDDFFKGFEKIYEASTELNLILKTRFNELELQITDAVETSMAGIENEYKAHNQSSKDLLRKSWHLLVTSIAFSLLTGTLISFFIAARITEPISKLMISSRKIADNDLCELSRQLRDLSMGDLRSDFHISASLLNIKAIDEVGQMAQAFDEIVHQLKQTEDAFAHMKQYLRKMAETTSSVAHGDLSLEPAVISKYDELGNSISTMVKNLRRSDAEVKQYQNHLQEIVEQRTRDLKKSNAQLLTTNKKLNREIQERKEAESALVESKNKLNLALQAAVMGIWEWEPATDKMILAGGHPLLLGIDR